MLSNACASALHVLVEVVMMTAVGRMEGREVVTVDRKQTSAPATPRFAVCSSASSAPASIHRRSETIPNSPRTILQQNCCNISIAEG
jgi:hypothetical protein